MYSKAVSVGLSQIEIQILSIHLTSQTELSIKILSYTQTAHKIPIAKIQITIHVTGYICHLVPTSTRSRPVTTGSNNRVRPLSGVSTISSESDIQPALMPSLFPHVPPTVNFVTDGEKGT